MHRCFTDPDPHELLAGFAGVDDADQPRTNDVYRVLVERGDSDPVAAGLLDEQTRQRASEAKAGSRARWLAPTRSGPDCESAMPPT